MNGIGKAALAGIKARMKNERLKKEFVVATTTDLMLTLGKSVDDALDIHNDLEKIISKDLHKKI